jgi:hypothetical protein
VESVKRRIEDEKKELQLSIDRYSQREYKKGTGNVVFAHTKENPREVQDLSSLIIPKRIQEGYNAFLLCSFQREQKWQRTCLSGHFKENPRRVQDMSSLTIPNRIQEWHRTCRLCSFQNESKGGTEHVFFAHPK